MSKLLDQCDEATELARVAFAAGDLVTGIAATQLAAQLVQLARLFERPNSERKVVTRRSGAVVTVNEADD